MALASLALDAAVVSARALVALVEALALTGAVRGAMIGHRVEWVSVLGVRLRRSAARIGVAALTYTVLTPLQAALACTCPRASYRALRNDAPLPITGWRW